MKLETDANGNIVLKEVFASLILETETGNKLSICMRDNTFEILVPARESWDSRVQWYRVDPETGTIKPIQVSKARQLVEEKAVAPATVRYVPEIWIPKIFKIDYLETFLNMDPKDIEPGIYYAADVDTQKELNSLITPVTEILQDMFETGYAGVRASVPLNRQPFIDIVKGILKADCQSLDDLGVNPITVQRQCGPVVWGNRVVHSVLTGISEVCAIRTIQINTKKILKQSKTKYGPDPTEEECEMQLIELTNQLEEVRRWMLSSRMVLELQFTINQGAPLCIDFAIKIRPGAPGHHRMRWYGGLNAAREFSDLEQYFG
jgi:hypothetical protein